MKFKKKASLLLAPLALTVFLAGCSDSDKNEEILAVVGDTEITYTELSDKLIQAYGKEELTNLITQEIAVQEAKKNKIEVTQEKIDESMAQYVEYYGGKELFNETLASYNMTKKDIEVEIKNALLLEAVIASTIEVKDEEVKAYFEDKADTYNTALSVAAKHILVKDEATAKDIQSRLGKGENWEDLASKFSIDEANKDAGGDLDFFEAGQMVEEFEKVAFSMEIGEISPPVKTEYGYHIINVYDRKDATVAEFEKVKDKVKEDYILTKVAESYEAWVSKKTDEYKVENNLNK